MLRESKKHCHARITSETRAILYFQVCLRLLCTYMQKICKICKICKHESHMQKTQNYALPILLMQ